MKVLVNIMGQCFKRMILILVRGYQWFISPIIPAHCAHSPTCSHYMLEAVQKHGAGRGIWLGLKRLLRCHPFSKGGYDPVP